MSGINRRDALKLAAATGAAVAGTVSVVGPKAQAQDEKKKYATAEERWAGRKVASARNLEKKSEPIAV